MAQKKYTLSQAKKRLAKQGRYGDTQLEHVNSSERYMLKKMGASRTTNPKTGLTENWGGGWSWTPPRIPTPKINITPKAIIEKVNPIKIVKQVQEGASHNLNEIKKQAVAGEKTWKHNYGEAEKNYHANLGPDALSWQEAGSKLHETVKAGVDFTGKMATDVGRLPIKLLYGQNAYDKGGVFGPPADPPDAPSVITDTSRIEGAFGATGRRRKKKKKFTDQDLPGSDKYLIGKRSARKSGRRGLSSPLKSGLSVPTKQGLAA